MPQYRHQEFAQVPRGWRVRTVASGEHRVRIAFPPSGGQRGRLVSLLHPKTERNPSPECLTVVEDAVKETGTPELGTPYQKKLSEGVIEICSSPVYYGHVNPGEGFRLYKVSTEYKPISVWAESPEQALTHAKSFGYKKVSIVRSFSPSEVKKRKGDINPSKSKTVEQIEALKAKAAQFVRDVVGDDDKADDLEDMSVEEYADRKRIHLVNPRRSRHNPSGLAKAWGQASEDMRKQLLASVRGPVALAHRPFNKLPVETQKVLVHAAMVQQGHLVLRNPKRNLDEIMEAQAKFEEFQGRPADGIREIQEPGRVRDDFWQIGWLVSFTIAPRTIEELVDLEFLDTDIEEEELESLKPDPAWVVVGSNARGEQIYLLQGDQDLEKNGTLDLFKADTSKDLIELGEVLSIVYLAKKTHIDQDWTEYEHEFGEEGGLPPIAFWNKLQKRIYLVGGTYRAKREGIVD